MERKWWTLVLISTATFMLLLDITVVNVALPDIQRELDASLSSRGMGMGFRLTFLRSECGRPSVDAPKKYKTLHPIPTPRI